MAIDIRACSILGRRHFFLSSPEGSSSHSSGLLRPLIEFFFPDASLGLLENINFFVRKTAHFTEYAVLFVLAFRAARLSGSPMLRERYLIYPMLLVMLVAALDEFNQSFEPSRTASSWDAMLDSTGGFAALICCWLAVRSRRGGSPRAGIAE